MQIRLKNRKEKVKGTSSGFYERSGFLEAGKFRSQFSYYQFIKKDSTLCS
jgi:hypothetical protein